jgi:hypothetical protein
MLDGLFHRGFLSLEGIIGAGSSVLCLMATAEFLAGLRYMKQSPIQQFQEDSVAVALGGERDYWTNSPWESLDDNTSSDHKTA